MHQVLSQQFSLAPYSSLEDWFSAIQHQPGAVLLHSGESCHDNAQYHIATGSPLLTLQLHSDGELKILSQSDDYSWLSGPGRTALKQITHQIQASPPESNRIMADAQKIQSQLFAQHSPGASSLPFQCGAIGYAGYDFGRFLESLPENAIDEYQTPVLSVSFYSWSLIQNQQSKECWLCFSDLYGHPAVEKLPVPAHQSFRLTSAWQSNMTQAEYRHKLDKIHQYLLSGDCYQVNLAQRFSAAYDGSEWQAWRALSEANQAPFSAFLRTTDSCILSCSPERFLSVYNGLIETKPIKGTRPRFTDERLDGESKQALLSSEKDQAENLMIVDLLRNDISKNASPHSVEVTGLFEIESFRSVHHMVSTIQAELKPESHPLKLLQDAFPGGSITGAPKIRAMEIIDELEPHRRNIYCGSVFFSSVNGDFDSSICIRTLLFENNKVYCWAGGGIVADSDAQSEYEETFHKVNKILPVLEVFRSEQDEP